MESSGIADAIRTEKGNLRYEYFQPILYTLSLKMRLHISQMRKTIGQ